MKLIGKISIIIALILGLLGVWTTWQNYTYEKVIVSAKVNIISVEVIPVRSGLSTIFYTGVFLRDGVLDTTKIKDTRAFTTKKPLPSLEELSNDTFYIHFVPENKKHETAFTDREPITPTAE